MPRTAMNTTCTWPSRTSSTRELHADPDTWIQEDNEQRPHQGRWCYGKTPMQTVLATVSLAKEKMLAA